MSKFAGPALPPAILHRESLVTRLNDVIATKDSPSGDGVAHYKLILLCAPAGYGKTTLLADFAQHTRVPCCWYFLDHTDTDRVTFLNNLLASIRHRFPGFGAALDPLLEVEISKDANQTLDSFVDALAATIATEISERFALLLCNYHEVNESPAVSGLVNQFLRKIPAQCVLIIESRATPSLDFASLLSRHEAVGWGVNMLRVTAEEIGDLARLQGVAPLSKVEAEQLAVSFDGWIAGILLGTRLGDAELLHASNRTSVLQGLPFMRVEREKLFAYLVDEIFGRQPAVYAFLKEAAVLKQMVPSLCDALLDITDASLHLERLARQGMFVSCSDEGPRTVYVCHPVLRELLCDELHRQSPERFATLHQRAAQLFAASHEYDLAIYHALEVDPQYIKGADHIVAHLIIEAHEQMLAKGQTETLLRWLDALPPATMECHPKLLLIRASLHLMKGEYTCASPLLDTASSMLISQPAVVDTNDLPKLRAEITILRSKALFHAGAYQEAQVLCQQVLDQTPADEVTLRAEAHARIGICVNILGDLASSVAHLQKALQLWGRQTVRLQTVDVHSALAAAYGWMGNFALAEHHLSRAISCCDQLNDVRGKVNNLIWLGVFKKYQGAFAEGEAALKEALSIARSARGFEREEAYVLINLGGLYQDEGLYDQSLQVIEDGLVLARQVHNNYLVNCGLFFLAMTYLLMGDASTAMLLLSETKLPPLNGDRVGYERATYELTYGMILLREGRYEEAYACLTAIEPSLKMAGLKREQVQAKIRIAACQLARKELSEVHRYLEEVTSILESQDGYGQVVLAGLNRFPTLQQVVRTEPTMERLRALLHMEIQVQEAKEVPTLSRGVMNRTPTTPAVAGQPRLKIQALGEPTVFLDERPITRWRMARSMELFFFLLDCGRPMRKEQIITALWSEVDDQINQTFHSTIYYLRKALSDSCIVSHAGTYALDLTSLYGDEAWYDVAVFKEHYARAKQFLANEDDTAARAALLTMVELYHGDYVLPFYSDWCTLRRDELRRAYLEARNQLANIAWRHEQFDESVVHWQHMLATDNCLEEAHYGLMRYYLRQGKRSLALRQYQRCVETLQQELAVQPGPSIQNLYQRIMGSSGSEQTKKPGRTTGTLEGTSRTR